MVRLSQVRFEKFFAVQRFFCPRGVVLKVIFHREKVDLEAFAGTKLMDGTPRGARLEGVLVKRLHC